MTISPSRSVALCTLTPCDFNGAGKRIDTRRTSNFRSIKYVPSRISKSMYRVPSAFHVTWYSCRAMVSMLSLARDTGWDPGNRAPSTPQR